MDAFPASGGVLYTVCGFGVARLAAAIRRDTELKIVWTDPLACEMEPVVNTVDEGGQKIPLQCYVRT